MFVNISLAVLCGSISLFLSLSMCVYLCLSFSHSHGVVLSMIDRYDFSLVSSTPIDVNRTSVLLFFRTRNVSMSIANVVSSFGGGGGFDVRRSFPNISTPGNNAISFLSPFGSTSFA